MAKPTKSAPRKKLILKTTKDYQYPLWALLARRAKLIIDQKQDEGTFYVKMSEGGWMLYEEVSNQYPIPRLSRILASQKKDRQKNQ
ncbi:MAG: hypothetical protein HC810_03735 [Acaryochloridaceae cyanobacterium RL_2_7]|nr:hypothetical protein [Acaryochloridaceae cyanobacterium RL_2_7]